VIQCGFVSNDSSTGAGSEVTAREQLILPVFLTLFAFIRVHWRFSFVFHRRFGLVSSSEKHLTVGRSKYKPFCVRDRIDAPMTKRCLFGAAFPCGEKRPNAAVASESFDRISLKQLLFCLLAWGLRL